ncbi:hypothetical protein Q1695_008884 [Nippostrongylus brasiliensis]|nr:hypothetical protein Q1695_008884 [Nippostrongylus brasiliensis]
MQKMGRMEIVDTIQNLVEHWGAPSANWFDYFIDARKLADVLSKPGNEETVGNLALQYAEQATSTQKEGEIMMSKNFSNEDIQFTHRKAACLFLCALACFAYVKWDFEYLIDKFNDILTVRILIEHFLALGRSSESNDALFAEWLFARWSMSVDRRFRIPPPPAKQTVNNPLLVPDLNLTKHENIRKMVVEIRTWLPQAVSTLEKIVAEAPEISVPDVMCFLVPFLEKGTASLNIGVVGDNVLCDFAPHPNFKLHAHTISSQEVVSVTRFELLQFHFANGTIETAQELLKLVVPTESPLSLVNIDKRVLHGYYMAFNMPSPFPAPSTTVKEFLPDQKLLTEDLSVFRRSKMWRMRAVRQTTGQLQIAFRSENAAKDVIEGCPTSVRQRLIDKVVQQRFIKSLQRQLALVRDPVKRRRIDALHIFLCATVFGIREELLRCEWNTPSRLRMMAVQAPKIACPPVNAQIVRVAVASDNPFWTIITSFNVAELKLAMSKLDRYVRPAMFVMPEMLAEIVLITRPVNELHALYLAKLYQLEKMKNRTDWDSHCTAYWHEFGLPESSGIMMLTEAVKVQGHCYSVRTLSHDIPDVAVEEMQLRTMKKIFKMNTDADTLKVQGGIAFAAQTFARALNADDWDFITTEVKVLCITTTMAQLLAAYLMSCATGKEMSQLRKVCETINAHITPCYDLSNRNGRRDLNRGRDRDERDRATNAVELYKFIGLIRSDSLLTLLITYFGYLFNRGLTTRKRSHLRVSLPMGEVFGHESEMSHLNFLAVQETLEMICRNAFAVNPTNPGWLRTAADFRYARGLLNEAGILYMEYLTASRQPLLAAPQDGQLEDLVWRRLRVCLSRSQYFYLSALVCQMIENKREEEYIKAMELIFSQLSLDAGANYSCLVFDNTLAELLSDIYERNHMQPSAEALFSFIYRSSMNPDARDILSREQSRRAQRLLRTLAAQLFDVHF